MDDSDIVYLRPGSTLRTIVLGVIAGLMLATLAVGFDARRASATSVDPDRAVYALPIKNISELIKALDQAWGSRSSADVAPNIAPLVIPEGIASLGTADKKRTFFRSMAPHVLAINERLRAQRALIINIRAAVVAGGVLDARDHGFIVGLGARYKIDGKVMAAIDSDPVALIDELLLRVDEIPASMVLAQAAIESAWGSSRFAREGNNIFGQWVFSKRGMRPKGAAKDANYSVAIYESIHDSVEAYERNINGLWAYEDFRAARARMRAAGQELDASVLAGGLLNYSTRREAYVKEVRTVIRQNSLERFDKMKLFSFNPVELDNLLEALREGIERPVKDA